MTTEESYEKGRAAGEAEEFLGILRIPREL